MKALTASLVALSLMTATLAHADSRDDVIEQQIQTDPQFAQKQQQAIALLKERGYQVVKVEAEVYLGQKALEIEAYKSGQEYDIIMDYASLKILKEERD